MDEWSFRTEISAIQPPRMVAQMRKHMGATVYHTGDFHKLCQQDGGPCLHTALMHYQRALPLLCGDPYSHVTALILQSQWFSDPSNLAYSCAEKYFFKLLKLINPLPLQEKKNMHELHLTHLKSDDSSVTSTFQTKIRHWGAVFLFESSVFFDWWCHRVRTSKVAKVLTNECAVLSVSV